MTTTDDIVLKPAVSFAFLKVLPLVLLALAFLLLAWCLSPYFILFSFVICAVAGYRLFYIRSFQYLISMEYIRFAKGLLFKREDRLEMYRIKDYIITRPLTLRCFQLMNLTLKSTDPENPVISLMGIEESDLTDIIRQRVQQARKSNNIVELN